MTEGIRGIGHGSTSGVGGGYMPPQNNKDVDENENNQNAAAQNNYEDTQVDPDKVMAFLANQNYFMPVQTEITSTEGVSEVDAETEERIAGYMERFEEIYAVIEQEFGAELAPAVMDLVMDKLMGMV